MSGKDIYADKTLCVQEIDGMSVVLQDKFNTISESGSTITMPTKSSASSKTSKGKVYSSGPSVTPILNKALAFDLKLCEDWDLSIDLKLPKQSTSQWRNVFGVQVKGIKDTLPGSRLPAVFIRKDEGNIHVSYTTIGYTSNHAYDLPDKFNTGNWFNLKLSQTNKVYEIKVDDKLVHTVTNSNSKAWSNVKIVMGNTYSINGISNILPAIGEYRNFDINSCPSACVSLLSTTTTTTTTSTTISTTTTTKKLTQPSGNKPAEKGAKFYHKRETNCFHNLEI